ncbi:hypothetical protein GCM10009676_01020 [Prauserella halophila]|uniref:Secreted protein n=1 Tax=Prauserella halophila TaxID=185641 RepID=A0ABN1VUH7_9PSEU|nr:hypothetical protein [Prauserella halophila]MCP2234554.1 hypothetical protein [Prauserella halophila]
MAIAALAGLSGCSGAPDARPATSTQPVTTTEQITVDPFTESGEPAAGLDIVEKGDGNCWQSWVSITGSNARRCAPVLTGDQHTSQEVHDPCYLHVRPGPDRAVCIQNPTTGEATGFDVVEDTGPAPEDAQRHRPWFVELADGRHCVLVPGADDPESTAEDPTYGCGSHDYLYGMPDTTTSVWTITNRHGEAVERAEAGPHRDRVSIRTVWF